MPSSPGYRRNYAQETRTAKARGETGGSDSENAKRLKLRRQMIKDGKVHRNDGKDVDHRTPLSKGGSNTEANARIRTPHANRSVPRNADGSMRRNVPKPKS